MFKKGQNLWNFLQGISMIKHFMGLGSWVIYLDKGPLLMIFASTRPFYGLWVLPNLEIYLIFWWIIILFLLLLLFIDIPVSLPNSLPSRYIANKIFPRVKMRIVASIFKVSTICAAHFHPLNWLTENHLSLHSSIQSCGVLETTATMYFWENPLIC